MQISTVRVPDAFTRERKIHKNLHFPFLQPRRRVYIQDYKQPYESVHTKCHILKSPKMWRNTDS